MRNKPKAQVVGLKTLQLKSGTGIFSGPVRPTKKRVFTDEQILFLNGCSIYDLKNRIKNGKVLIELLYRPEFAINKALADQVSSNLRFQIEIISNIIVEKERMLKNG